MFEIAGVPLDVAKEALRLAAQKLPVKNKLSLHATTTLKLKDYETSRN